MSKCRNGQLANTACILLAKAINGCWVRICFCCLSFTKPYYLPYIDNSGCLRGLALPAAYLVASMQLSSVASAGESKRSFYRTGPPSLSCLTAAFPRCSHGSHSLVKQLQGEATLIFRPGAVLYRAIIGPFRRRRRHQGTRHSHGEGSTYYGVTCCGHSQVAAALRYLTLQPKRSCPKLATEQL
jgi:hypothetical protein